MDTGEIDQRFPWGSELEFIDIEEVVTVDVVMVMMQEVGAFGVLAFIFIELGACDPEFEGVLAEGAEEDGRFSCPICEPLTGADFTAIFLYQLFVFFGIHGSVRIDKGIGSEAGGAGKVFRNGFLVFYRFDDMAFGLFPFEDIEVIGRGVFFGWGEIIFNALV